ncbi:MAG TPA: T9SS type A sorting domain-containing protein [Chitinophagaceae bacterium]|nr:T9SS type A sorting domain-containing protein [Chitinophagaceae bacterium]
MKKILLSLSILAVMGLTAKVNAQCNGASVSITNFTAVPNSTSVSYGFNWEYVKGNASIEVAILCNGVQQSSILCLPFLKDSAAGNHSVSGTFAIVCSGVIRVEIRVWANNSCGGTNCIAAFREVSQSTLPVDFKSFTATRNHSNVLLKWETLTEKNNTGFAVERNINGNWQQVGFVASQAPAGNSADIISYQFVDLNNTKGISQYRLRQIDFDNRSKYSEIRSVRGESQIGQIIVYPNPSIDGRVNVSFEDAAAIRSVSVMDMSGRIVMQWKAVTNNNLMIENLQPGMYTLRVLVPETGEQVVTKFVVNKR